MILKQNLKNSSPTNDHIIQKLLDVFFFYLLIENLFPAKFLCSKAGPAAVYFNLTTWHLAGSHDYKRVQ